MKSTEWYKKPELYDIAGIFVFAYLTSVSLLALIANDYCLDSAHLGIIAVIGILGLIIDGSMVYLGFIKKR